MVLAECQADTSSTWEQIVYNITGGGYLPTAVGAWLDLLGIGWFDNPRNSPLQAIIQLRLTDTAGAGPWQLANPVAVAYPTSPNPLYYRSQAGTVNIPRNGFVDAIFYAEAPGAVYNVAPGQITDLATPIPGVTVTSPAIGNTGVITAQAGQDAEKDGPYRTRLQAQWGLLAQGYVVAKILTLTQQALPGRTLRQVVLDPGPVPGVPYSYLADINGPVSFADCLTVYNYLADPSRRPVGNWPVQVYPATVLLQDITWTLYLDGTNPNAQSDCAERLQAYEETTLPGQVIHMSRLIDVAVNGATDGVIGAIPGLGPNVTFPEVIRLAPPQILEMVPTFVTVG